MEHPARGRDVDRAVELGVGQAKEGVSWGRAERRLLRCGEGMGIHVSSAPMALPWTGRMMERGNEGKKQ